MDNLVFITGKLVADSEIRYFTTGKCKCTFTIAVDNYINKEKLTSFIKYEAWEKQAEFVGEYFKKGSNIVVSGELIKSEYKEKMYYNLVCKTANFASSLMVISGKIDDIDDNNIYILTKNNSIIAKSFIKNLQVGEQEKTFLLNFAIKDNEPIYTLLGV